MPTFKASVLSSISEYTLSFFLPHTTDLKLQSSDHFRHDGFEQSLSPCRVEVDLSQCAAQTLYLRKLIFQYALAPKKCVNHSACVLSQSLACHNREDLMLPWNKKALLRYKGSTLTCKYGILWCKTVFLKKSSDARLSFYSLICWASSKSLFSAVWAYAGLSPVTTDNDNSFDACG